MTALGNNQPISNELMDKIIKKFEELGVNHPCPRCGNSSFSIVTEGLATYVIQPSNLSSINVQGQNLPAVITYCQKCGYLSLHSVNIMGLLPILGEKK
jgi:hypothetical protein